MIARHPWIFIVLAFLLLIGAWVTLINLAVRNAPEQIEVQPSSPSSPEQ